MPSAYEVLLLDITPQLYVHPPTETLGTVGTKTTIPPGGQLLRNFFSMDLTLLRCRERARHSILHASNAGFSVDEFQSFPLKSTGVQYPFSSSQGTTHKPPVLSSHLASGRPRQHRL
ncbi:hypothetical protein ACRALDRAFT_208799 [Sodiomyces alcalophilus JCM 7366]|uniref:uncharacterized protein n=1 Tax=Sodiomyces alcalophilus JCM 7366 TaxID=591952 RepID=UPI0039B688B9